MKVSHRWRQHERVVRQALVQLFGLQLRTGIEVPALERLAQECIREAARTVETRSKKTRDMCDAQDYGGVLREWHRDAGYLSADGFPRPLALHGKFSLRTLVEKFYPRTQFKRVVDSLSEAGLIKEQRYGKWLPTERCAVFPKLNDELLMHVAEGISQLVQTVTTNVTSDRGDTLFERSAKVRFFPRRAGREFKAFMNAQGSAFLSTVDDWLESRSKPNKNGSRKKTCEAGVFTFAFMGNATLHRRRRTPKTSRRLL